MPICTYRKSTKHPKFNDSENIYKLTHAIEEVHVGDSQKHGQYSIYYKWESWTIHSHLSIKDLTLACQTHPPIPQLL